MKIEIKENSITIDGVEYEKKDLPKPLKEGDLAIFWENQKSTSIIAVLKKIDEGHYTNEGVHYTNAIPFESIEQYKEFIK